MFRGKSDGSCSIINVLDLRKGRYHVKEARCQKQIRMLLRKCLMRYNIIGHFFFINFRNHFTGKLLNITVAVCLWPG